MGGRWHLKLVGDVLRNLNCPAGAQCRSYVLEFGPDGHDVLGQRGPIPFCVRHRRLRIAATLQMHTDSHWRRGHVRPRDVVGHAAISGVCRDWGSAGKGSGIGESAC